MATLSQKDQKIMQDVDKLLTDLSTEFNVPKPNYCIFKIKILKRLGKWNLGPDYLGLVTIQMKNYDPPFLFAACFVPGGFSGNRKGPDCYITLLSKNNRPVSKRFIIHEFFHYKHYVESDYDWSNRTSEEQKQEEKRTESETRKYMRKLREKVK